MGGQGRPKSAPEWPEFGFGAVQRPPNWGMTPEMDPKWLPQLPLIDLSPFPDLSKNSSLLLDNINYLTMWKFWNPLKLPKIILVAQKTLKLSKKYLYLISPFWWDHRKTCFSAPKGAISALSEKGCHIESKVYPLFQKKPGSLSKITMFSDQNIPQNLGKSRVFFQPIVI